MMMQITETCFVSVFIVQASRRPSRSLRTDPGQEMHNHAKFTIKLMKVFNAERIKNWLSNLLKHKLIKIANIIGVADSNVYKGIFSKFISLILLY